MQGEGGSEDEFTNGNRGVRVPIENIPNLFNDGIFVPIASGDDDDNDVTYYEDENDEDEETSSKHQI